MSYLFLTIAISTVLVGWNNIFSPGYILEVRGMDIALIIGLWVFTFVVIGGKFKTFSKIIMAPVLFMLLATIGLSAFFSMTSASAIAGILFLYFVYGQDESLRDLFYYFGMVAVWSCVFVTDSLMSWSALLVVTFIVWVMCSRLIYIRYKPV